MCHVTKVHSVNLHCSSANTLTAHILVIWFGTNNGFRTKVSKKVTEETTLVKTFFQKQQESESSFLLGVCLGVEGKISNMNRRLWHIGAK